MTARASRWRLLRIRNIGDSGIHSRTKISKIAGNTMARSGGRQSAHILTNQAEVKPARDAPNGGGYCESEASGTQQSTAAQKSAKLPVTPWPAVADANPPTY